MFSSQKPRMAPESQDMPPSIRKAEVASACSQPLRTRLRPSHHVSNIPQLGLDLAASIGYWQATSATIPTCLLVLRRSRLRIIQPQPTTALAATVRNQDNHFCPFPQTPSLLFLLFSSQSRKQPISYRHYLIEPTYCHLPGTRGVRRTCSSNELSKCRERGMAPKRTGRRKRILER